MSALVAILVLVGAAYVADQVLGAFTSRPAAPSPSAVPPRPQRLEGIVAYRNASIWRVCGRQPLHACRARWGYENSGDRGTFVFEPTDIAAPASCDDQTDRALARCADAGATLSGEAGRTELARCLAPYGIFMRGTSLMREVDPRDPQEQPGTFRIDCREGYREFTFDDRL